MRRRLIVMFAMATVTLTGLLVTGALRGTQAHSTTGGFVAAAVGPRVAGPGHGRTQTIRSPAVTGWRTCLVGGPQACGVQSACSEDVDATVVVGGVEIDRAHCPSPTRGLRLPIPATPLRPGRHPAASGSRPRHTP